MPRISESSLEEIRAALADYNRELQESGMTIGSQKTAFGDAQRFTCWLADCYRPMQTLPCRCPVDR